MPYYAGKSGAMMDFVTMIPDHQATGRTAFMFTSYNRIQISDKKLRSLGQYSQYWELNLSNVKVNRFVSEGSCKVLTCTKPALTGKLCATVSTHFITFCGT